MASSIVDRSGVVDKLVEFLTFKSLPPPPSARCDVVVSSPTTKSLVDFAGNGRPWGVINLGEEATSLIVVESCASVRFVLGPGEGCRLPDHIPIVNSYLGDKQELDVLLVVVR
jgi:hypothetical protein